MSEHDSRKATENNGYERLRRTGVSHSEAKKIARDASEQTHKNVDRAHSDKPPQKKR